MKFQETFGLKGEWKAYVADGAPLSFSELAVLRAGGKIDRVVRTYEYHNIIPTVARLQIAKMLSANVSTLAETKITHQELGTGTTTPANGDTGLQTPDGTTRKAISSGAYDSNKLNLTCFWSAGEATGTWRELGTFINGSMTSNSGVIFNHVAINVVVGSGNSLTLDGEITIT